MRILTIGHSFVVSENRNVMKTLAEQAGIDLLIVSPRQMKSEMGVINAEDEKGVVLVDSYMSQKIHLFFYVGISNIIEKFKPDLVYIWEEPYILSGFQVARICNKLNFPYVFSTFQNKNKTYMFPFSYFEKFVISHAIGWIPHATKVRDTLLTKNYNPNKYQLITMAVSKKRFFPNSSMREKTRGMLGLKNFTFCFMGRLREDKGIKLLMNAFADLSGEWNWLVLGTGPERENLQSWLVKHKLQQRVKIVHAKHEEVPQYLRACDALLAPSQTTPIWEEQFGRMIIEAFASGLAVVGSSSGEIPHVIKDAGLILPEKDINAWKKTMQELLDDNALCKDLASRGLERFNNNYESKKIADQYLNFFQSCLESSK